MDAPSEPSGGKSLGEPSLSQTSSPATEREGAAISVTGVQPSVGASPGASAGVSGSRWRCLQRLFPTNFPSVDPTMTLSTYLQAPLCNTSLPHDHTHPRQSVPGQDGQLLTALEQTWGLLTQCSPRDIRGRFVEGVSGSASAGADSSRLSWLSPLPCVDQARLKGKEPCGLQTQSLEATARALRQGEL